MSTHATSSAPQIVHLLGDGLLPPHDNYVTGGPISMTPVAENVTCLECLEWVHA